MTRAELQRLARDRLRDAKALLAARRWSGAYYLSGYAVECALKACIIVHLMKSDKFPDRKYSELCWTHNLNQLVGLADLHAALAARVSVDPIFAKHWSFVRDWSEVSRYERKTKAKALALYTAIVDKKHGMFPWIKSHW